MMFFFLILFAGHLNSVYHPHLIYKKYIRIKNKFLQKILIDDMISLTGGIRKNNKGNLNKLSLIGLFYYIIAFLWLIFYLVYSHYFDVTIPFLIAILLSWFGILVFSINTSKIIKEFPYAKLNTILNYIGIFIIGIFALFLFIITVIYLFS